MRRLRATCEGSGRPPTKLRDRLPWGNCQAHDDTDAEPVAPAYLHHFASLFLKIQAPEKRRLDPQEAWRHVHTSAAPNVGENGRYLCSILSNKRLVYISFHRSRNIRHGS